MSREEAYLKTSMITAWLEKRGAEHLQESEPILQLLNRNTKDDKPAKRKGSFWITVLEGLVPDVLALSPGSMG